MATSDTRDGVSGDAVPGDGGSGSALWRTYARLGQGAVTAVTRDWSFGRRRVHSTSAEATPATADRPILELQTDEG